MLNRATRFCGNGSVLGLVLILWISYSQIHLAMHKPFWLDEGVEIAGACGQSYTSLLIDGPTQQCSPPPLYYIVQNLVVRNIKSFDHGILYLYRAISLISSLLCMILIVEIFRRRLGFSWALLGLILLNNHPIFHLYAAENRPYMLWMFFFTVLILFATHLAQKKWIEISSIEKFAFIAFSLALTFVAGPGALQMAVTCGVCAWIGCRKFLRYFTPLVGFCGIVGLYYGLRSCSFADAGPNDLLRTKDFQLVIDVFHLLLPSGTIISILFNVLLAIGLAYPFIVLKYRKSLKPDQHFVFVLSMLVSGQLILTLFLGVLIAIKHYFFVQRMFIYLVVCRAILVVLGAYIFYTVFSHFFLRKHSSLQKFATVILTLLMLTATGLSLQKSKRFFDKYILLNDYAWTKTDVSPCKSWEGRVAVYTIPHQIQSQPQVAPNFLVRLSRTLERCGWRTGQNTNYILAKSDSDQREWYEISQTPLPKSVPMQQCGRKIVLEP